ncbi:unnamed protein product [Amoebophrya sp. A25]|nr:unnamed protein product [Amoebophrya sp. A25]|eukprot:GSA25T00018555001.1
MQFLFAKNTELKKDVLKCKKAAVAYLQGDRKFTSFGVGKMQDFCLEHWIPMTAGLEDTFPEDVTK